MEAENRNRIFYGSPLKVLMVLLTFCGIFLCAIFGSALLHLGGISSTDPFALDETTEYQETDGCGEQMVYDLSHLSNYLEERGRFDVDGRYDPDRLVDLAGDEAGKEPAANTSYTLEDLYTLHNSGVADQLREWAESSQSISGEEFQGDASEEVSSEYGNYYMSEEVWKHLQSVAGGVSFSSQFLYLYGYGYQAEMEAGVRTAAGSTLADYAAAHPNEVSLYDLYMNLYRKASQAAEYMWTLKEGAALQNSNFCYYISDGEVVYTNVNSWEKASLEEVSRQIQGWPLELSYVRKNGSLEEGSVFPDTPAGYRLREYLSLNSLLSEDETVLLGLRSGYPMEDDYRAKSEFFDSLVPNKNLLLALAVAGVCLAVASLAIGTFQSGRNPENKEIRLYAFDRLPTEAAGAVSLLLILLGLGFTGWPLLNLAYRYEQFSPLSLVFSSAAVVMDTGIFLLLYYSLVRRLKAHNLWERSLLRAVIRLGTRAYGARKASTRVIWAGILLILLHFILLPNAGLFGHTFCLVVDVLVLLYLLRDAAGRQTVEEGLKQIGTGNLDYQVDTAELRGDNLELAQLINSMGQGLKESVSRQMKNERMQADLITNVSHDLKTPLTSIINYVDLLKRENIKEPKIKNYIDVLERKSQRLKQLAEDLVEASRASSGNVKLEIVTLNLNELVQQVNGEFSERFEARSLELICHLPLESALLKADGRYIWRVLENLYGNAAKYAMPSTRVYVDVVKKAGMVMLSIKNVSEQTLNISADELMERFVRGDSSRTTEGSGLGLSIAKNLVILMGGSFELYVDGDLFKAILTFPEARGETAGRGEAMERQDFVLRKSEK